MKRFPVLMFLMLVACLLTATGCGQEKTHLMLEDLTPAENLYLTRIVILERAKAVTMVDRQTGTTLLDSLAIAWGDSSLKETVAGAPTTPDRSGLVHGLLARILKAEKDSLMHAPRPDRLTAPLPNPVPVEESVPLSKGK